MRLWRREHLALHRKGKPLAAALKGAGEIGFAHYFSHLFTDCGADPAVLYGRYCWSTVPRICGDVGGSDFNLRRRLTLTPMMCARKVQPATSA